MRRPGSWLGAEDEEFGAKRGEPQFPGESPRVQLRDTRVTER